MSSASYETLIKTIALSIRFSNEKKVKVHGMTNPQGRLLGLIYRKNQKKEVITRKSLQEELNVSGPSVTGLLNALEQKGFITRRSGIVDARTIDIKVTTKGKKLISQMENIFNDNSRKLVAGLTKEEKKELYKLLSKIYDNISQDMNKSFIMIGSMFDSLF